MDNREYGDQRNNTRLGYWNKKSWMLGAKGKMLRSVYRAVVSKFS